MIKDHNKRKKQYEIGCLPSIVTIIKQCAWKVQSRFFNVTIWGQICCDSAANLSIKFLLLKKRLRRSIVATTILRLVFAHNETILDTSQSCMINAATAAMNSATVPDHRPKSPQSPALTETRTSRLLPSDSSRPSPNPQGPELKLHNTTIDRHLQHG